MLSYSSFLPFYFDDSVVNLSEGLACGMCHAVTINSYKESVPFCYNPVFLHLLDILYADGSKFCRFNKQATKTN